VLLFHVAAELAFASISLRASALVSGRKKTAAVVAEGQLPGGQYLYRINWIHDGVFLESSSVDIQL
jgi:hypothetical protein